jgi:hypothetical protein
MAALLWTAALPSLLQASPSGIEVTQAPDEVEAYDFVEVTVGVQRPDAKNPFTDASVTGSFAKADGTARHEVEGFCDSADGSVYRIRFMPSAPGAYTYSLAYRQGAFETTRTGTFQTIDGRRRGPIRVDPKYPWHFIWEGTGEHYFFNGTTAYFLLGWRDDRTIDYSIDRLHRLKVNRLRVTVAGREDILFGEPVMNSFTGFWHTDKYDPGKFTTFLTPWLSRRPYDIYSPEFDYTRFDVGFWQKFDRALRFARDRDMIISLVLDMGDNKCHLEAGSEDERRFIRYAAARFGAFSNITWDLGDDLDRFRTDEWTRSTGNLVEQLDPYRHLATSHPIEDVHQDRTSDWFGFTSFQDWSREQHAYILKKREIQRKTGRIIPQANEEYGYEDHYPEWASPGSDSAEVLRRTAWDIYMAGGYQTAGETARRGTNIWPDTGGGWLNGRGDDTMTMFLGYGHIVDFFTSFDWWKADPHDELVNNADYCLAKPGEIYAVYLPKAGSVTVRLEPGAYSAHWFGATTGETIPLPDPSGPTWTSPAAPDRSDWALLLTRKP